MKETKLQNDRKNKFTTVIPAFLCSITVVLQLPMIHRNFREIICVQKLENVSTVKKEIEKKNGGKREKEKPFRIRALEKAHNVKITALIDAERVLQ